MVFLHSWGTICQCHASKSWRSVFLGFPKHHLFLLVFCTVGVKRSNITKTLLLLYKWNLINISDQNAVLLCTCPVNSSSSKLMLNFYLESAVHPTGDHCSVDQWKIKDRTERQYLRVSYTQSVKTWEVSLSPLTAPWRVWGVEGLQCYPSEIWLHTHALPQTRWVEQRVSRGCYSSCVNYHE